MLVVCIFASALGALIMCLLVLRDGFSPISADPSRADHDVLITRLGHAIAGACFATTAILATVLVARTPVRPVVAAPNPQITERLTALDRDRTALGAQVSALEATMQTLREQVGAVGGGVQSMGSRLDQAETRVAKTESGLATAEAGLKRLGDDIVQANARARQLERSVPAKPVATAPREIVVPPAPPAPPRRTEVERPQESASLSTTHAAPPAPATSAAPVASPPSVTAVPPVTATPPPTPIVSTAPKPAPIAKPAPAAAASAPKDTPPTSMADKLRNDWKAIRKGFASAPDDFAAAVRDFSRRASGGD
jgi:hypothetical protein